MKTPITVLLLILGLNLFANDDKAVKPLSVDDTKAIEAKLGEKITVEGTVQESFWVRGDVLMITFRKEEEGFIAVSFRKHRKVLDEAFEKDVAKHLTGKRIRIRGTVKEYKYRPQIVISDPAQLTVL